MPDVNGSTKFTLALVGLLCAFGASIVGLGIWAGKLDARMAEVMVQLGAHKAQPAHFDAHRQFGVLHQLLQDILRRLERIERRSDNGPTP